MIVSKRDLILLENLKAAEDPEEVLGMVADVMAEMNDDELMDMYLSAVVELKRRGLTLQ